MTEYTIKKGVPYPLGVSLQRDGINFSMVIPFDGEYGIILYLKNKQPVRLAFTKEHRIGNIFCGCLIGDTNHLEAYSFYRDKELIEDACAKRILGDKKYGLLTGDFDWQGTENPRLSYEDSVFYCLHVRGFTKHASSKVKGRGTFLGIQEKIPYLKELGVTTLELLPAYEFESSEVLTAKEDTQGSVVVRTNYWGFKNGNYYLPKRSYTYGKEPEFETKELVRSLHKENMELILQFYFSKDVSAYTILEILRFWVLEYRVDGFHLKGEGVPADILRKEPLLAETKLLFDTLNGGEDSIQLQSGMQKNTGWYRDDFYYDIRKFLKGDEGQTEFFLRYQRRNSLNYANIHFITNYYGFTLQDMVTYEKKNNLANGENNRDGMEYNYSWNCGVEGVTRKKSIVKLRQKQMKNALCLLLLAQGTPMILSGDEFCQTQGGNNNPYCQDNDTTWLNWNLLRRNEEHFLFLKELIALRKEHSILRRKQEPKMMDSLSCGYPDLSYHGEEAWRPCLEYHSRSAAALYCEKYADRPKESFLYIVYNMHWDNLRFALPKLPKGMQFRKILGTGESKQIEEIKDQKIEVEGRSVCVYLGSF